jgi:hypothetical protein
MDQILWFKVISNNNKVMCRNSSNIKVPRRWFMAEKQWTTSRPRGCKRCTKIRCRTRIWESLKMNLGPMGINLNQRSIMHQQITWRMLQEPLRAWLRMVNRTWDNPGIKIHWLITLMVSRIIRVRSTTSRLDLRDWLVALVGWAVQDAKFISNQVRLWYQTTITSTLTPSIVFNKPNTTSNKVLVSSLINKTTSWMPAFAPPATTNADK